MGGAYRWDNSGKSWIPLFDGISNPNLMAIDGMATDPINPDVVYCAAGYTLAANAIGSILKSTNRGTTWTQVTLPVPMNGNANVRGLGNRLVIDPNNNSKLYFASRTKGLWKSTNSGASWMKITSFPTHGDTLNGVGLTTVIVDNKNSNRLYVAAASFDNMQSIYQSTDGGNSWRVIRGPITTGSMKYVIHHMELGSDGNLWCTFGNDYAPFPLTHTKTELRGLVYKYNTATGQWRNVSPSLSYGIFAGLSINAQNPNHVIVSTNLNYTPDRIWGTVDGGTTWTLVAKPTVSWDSNPLNSTKFDSDGGRTSAPDAVNPIMGNSTTHWMEAIAINPFNSSNAFFCTGAGVYSSDNILEPIFSNILWTNRWKGMEQSVALDLTASVNGALFSCLGDIGGMRHFDFDKPLRSKQGFYTNPGSASTSGLDYAGRNPKLVVRIARDLIGYSSDNGLSWSPCPGNPTGSFGKIAVSSLGNHLVYSQAADGNFVYYSDDNGTTWNASNYRFTNNFGVSWTQESMPAAARVISDRVNDNLFFALYNNEVFVSVDGGHLFVQKSNLVSGAYKTVSTGLPRAVFGVEGEFWAMDANNVNGVGTPGGSLTRFIWKNNQLTFEKKASTVWSYGWPKFNVGPIGVKSIGFGKAAPGANYPTLYLLGNVFNERYSNRGWGVYRSTDIGVTWTKINNQDQYYVNPQFCAGDESIYGRVYIATNGRGLLFGDSNVPYTDNCGEIVGASSSLHECASVLQGVYNISSVSNEPMNFTSASTSVVQQTDNTSNAQLWEIEELNNTGYYAIKNIATQKFLTYYSLTSGSRIHAFSSTPTEWRLEQNGITEQGTPRYRLIPANDLKLNVSLKTSTGINFFLNARSDNDKHWVILNRVSAAMSRIANTAEEKTLKVSLFPNPSMNVFTIQLEGEFSYSVYTLEGNSVVAGKAHSEIQIGQELPAGLYLLKVVSENETKNIILVKQ
jgi:hypothetical protein